MIKEIQVSKLLSLEEFDKLKEMALELEEAVDSVQRHRTRTEMEVSVLNDLKFPTSASKYWQSIREQCAMFQGVAMLSFDYREENVRIKVLQQRILQESDELKKELLQIKLERKRYLVEDMKRTAKARIREIKDWSEIKSRESKQMTEEELAEVGNHQLISYTKRWINQRIEMGSSGSPSERHNLLGQLQSGIKLCIEKKLLNQVLVEYNPKLRKQILIEYGVE